MKGGESKYLKNIWPRRRFLDVQVLGVWFNLACVVVVVVVMMMMMMIWWWWRRLWSWWLWWTFCPNKEVVHKVLNVFTAEVLTTFQPPGAEHGNEEVDYLTTTTLKAASRSTAHCWMFFKRHVLRDKVWPVSGELVGSSDASKSAKNCQLWQGCAVAMLVWSARGEVVA